MREHLRICALPSCRVESTRLLRTSLLRVTVRESIVQLIAITLLNPQNARVKELAITPELAIPPLIPGYHPPLTSPGAPPVGLWRHRDARTERHSHVDARQHLPPWLRAQGLRTQAAPVPTEAPEPGGGRRACGTSSGRRRRATPADGRTVSWQLVRGCRRGLGGGRSAART